ALEPRTFAHGARRVAAHEHGEVGLVALHALDLEAARAPVAELRVALEEREAEEPGRDDVNDERRVRTPEPRAREPGAVELRFEPVPHAGELRAAPGHHL